MQELKVAGTYLRTFTGFRVDLLAPEAKDICIEDIAHALSNTCRWGGQCNPFFSVAQHSMLVASSVSPRLRRQALLHDASEAYICDLPSPLKRALTNYREIEGRLMRVIAQRFNFSWPKSEEVSAADEYWMNLEGINFFDPPQFVERVPPEDRNLRIRAMLPREAELEFLSWFEGV